MPRVPMGVTDFARLRDEKNGYFYVDKTRYLHELVAWPPRILIARPRGFGKTLFLSSLECLLKGRRDLFKGLWIDSVGYDWPCCPVIRLDMGSMAALTTEKMEDKLSKHLKRLAKSEGLGWDLRDTRGVSAEKLMRLAIWDLKKKYGRDVAVLVDDSDAPITAHFGNPPLAERFRRAVEDFFIGLKDNPKVSLIFMTGASRFSPTTFSSRTCHKDATFFDGCHGMLGFTLSELDVLLGELGDALLPRVVENGGLPPGASREDLRELILGWGDGYNWGGEGNLLNPSQVFDFIEKAKGGEYFRQRGLSDERLRKFCARGASPFDLTRGFPSLSEADLRIDEIASWRASAYLFQAGRLTVKESLDGPSGRFFRLGLPNLEVASRLISLNLSVKPPKDPMAAKRLAGEIFAALADFDESKLEKAFEGYLEQYPRFLGLEGLERGCRTLLRSAMLLIDKDLRDCEPADGEGGDLILSIPDGDTFIIRTRSLNESELSSGELQGAGFQNEASSNNGKSQGRKTNKPSKNARGDAAESAIALRDTLARLAQKALGQMSERPPALYRKGSSPAIKVVLAVASPSIVLARIAAPLAKRK